MNAIQHHCEIRSFIEQRFKVFDSFFFRQVQSKLLLYLLVYIPVLDIWDICIHHQSNKIQDKVGAFAEDCEGCETEVLEAGIMGGLCASHAIHHFLADFDWWRERLRISPKDVPKVNCMKLI